MTQNKKQNKKKRKVVQLEIQKFTLFYIEKKKQRKTTTTRNAKQGVFVSINRVYQRTYIFVSVKKNKKKTKEKGWV